MKRKKRILCAAVFLTVLMGLLPWNTLRTPSAGFSMRMGGSMMQTLNR